MKLFTLNKSKKAVLERALVFTIACHGVAMLSMLIFLLPGIPGGSSDLAHRIAYISAHPIQWRLGWFPWQLTALSDLVLAYCLVRTSWIPRLPALGALGLTIVAIAFEQPAEYRWITSGIELAHDAVRYGSYSGYSAFEQEVFRLTSHWAAFFYTLAAIGWSISLAMSGTWNRFITWLSCGLWGLLIVVSLGPLLKPNLGSKLVSIGNAIGFIFMMVWFCLVLVMVMRRSQSTPRFGEKYCEWIIQKLG